MEHIVRPVSYRKACWALVLSLFAFAALLVIAGPFAFAANAPEVPIGADTALPITWQATLAAIIMAVVIPWLNAFLTDHTAPAWLTGPLSGLLAFLGAGAAYLVDLQGVPDWQHLVGLIFVAVIGAAGFRTVVEPGVEPALKAGGLHAGATA